jgi:hypothetical protein
MSILNDIEMIFMSSHLSFSATITLFCLVNHVLMNGTSLPVVLLVVTGRATATMLVQEEQVEKVGLTVAATAAGEEEDQHDAYQSSLENGQQGSFTMDDHGNEVYKDLLISMDDNNEDSYTGEQLAKWWYDGKDSNTNKEAINYRVSYNNPEDYTISMLVNPCGANGTHDGVDKTIALGYDCCMNQFGQGEYGYLKYINGRELSEMEALETRRFVSQHEVLHNMVLVNENGEMIPYESSRRADDHIEIDESCTGLRKPHTSCWGNRLKAVPSPYVPSCWDHNQTVDATLQCYDPQGRRKSNCMQISYSQNAIINICNSSHNQVETSSASNVNCGTFIEIHQHSSLSFYESNLSVLAESKVSTEVTSGMYTVTIDLTYKTDKRRLLCNLQDDKIQVGSMVKILNHSPLCCCPSKYDHNTQQGSFFCPVKDFEGSGPFATKHVTLEEEIKLDEQHAEYPQCPFHSVDEDVLMCSLRIVDYSGEMESKIHNMISGSKTMIMPERCIPIHKLSNGSYSSNHLDGVYSAPCSHGKTFSSCGGISSSSQHGECIGNDYAFSFRGKIGKVISIPNHETDAYSVTFNDGRTSYHFLEHEIQIQSPNSNYELWFVHRNRYERVIHKHKGFKVIWPQCTFDMKSNKYFPYAQVADDGEILEVIG